MNNEKSYHASFIFRNGWLPRLFVSILIPWALAGFFMGGEDEFDQTVPWLVVLGGGMAGEREKLACQLYSQGHGALGVVLTGGNVESFVPDRMELLRRCGIPSKLMKNWENPTNTYEEMMAVGRFAEAVPGVSVIVVSDALHMPRLHYLRDKLALTGKVFLRQSRAGWHLQSDYFIRRVIFWFREPLAYVFYRLKH